jgi:cytoskeletal protein RodZ
MDEIGHILREARENKGFTLQQVQEETRINSRFLNALEEGDYGALPTPVHVRGFLRNYARFLGLDPQPLLDRYQAVQGVPYLPAPNSNGEISSDNPLPVRQDQVFFDPVNVEVEGGGRSLGSSEGLLQLIIIIALIIALALIANRFLPLLLGNERNGNAVEEISGAVRDVLSTVNGDADATATAEAALAAGATAGDNVIIEGAVAADETGGFIANTSRNAPALQPTVTPTRPALPPALDEIRLKLDILERTWIEVTIDGDVVFSGIARDADTFEWTAAQEAKVTTGNAIGVFVTINEIELGRLGGRGEQHEEVWRTAQQ